MDDHLIAAVNALQQVTASIGGDALDLPQVCVVGSQSSGKSSVLETIVGKVRASGLPSRAYNLTLAYRTFYLEAPASSLGAFAPDAAAGR